MKIAVDFDGTIVEHQYPSIGPELVFSIETLLELQKQKHQLILWTYRSGKELDDAVEFCAKRGLEFYAINANYPEEVFDGSISRKINADIFIDDRNIGGFVGWQQVYEMITTDNCFVPLTQSEIFSEESPKKNFFQRIFSKGGF